LNNWLKIKDVATILNISNSNLHTIICKEEFKDLVIFNKPFHINFNIKFIKLIKKYLHNKEKIVTNISKPKEWTQSSIYCYKIGCNCQKCDIYEIMETKCQMKRVVLELVKLYGPPKIERNDIL